MHVLEAVAAVRAARRELGILGLVPTMGYLHAGHMALVEQAKAENQAVAASIFVNPAQFGPAEDFARYPRDLPRDLAMLEAAGVDLVFVPPVAEMYSEGYSTYVEVEGITRLLEGAARPGHFRGVATVVCKLLNIMDAERAYFGQKDAQQTVVVQQMVRDLNLRTQIVVVPTVREADGLALSSRNAYLSPEERERALGLSRAQQTAARVLSGLVPSSLAAAVALADAEGDAAHGVLGLEARAQGAADEADRGGEDGQLEVVARTHSVAQGRGDGALREHQGG
jgi:pantoate--beta-alanine ligase